MARAGEDQLKKKQRSVVLTVADYTRASVMPAFSRENTREVESFWPGSIDVQQQHSALEKRGNVELTCARIPLGQAWYTLEAEAARNNGVTNCGMRWPLGQGYVEG